MTRLAAILAVLSLVIVTTTGCPPESGSAPAPATPGSTTPPAATPETPETPATPEAPEAPAAPAAKQTKLLLELPKGNNTPDGMCLLDDGSFILSVPNFNNLEEGARLLRITADNKAEEFLELGKHPETGDLVGPLGVCLAPSGDLFLADFQLNGNKQSRVLRIPMTDGKPGEPVPAITGFHVSNAVLCDETYLYVSETQIDTEATPATSGVLRFKLADLEQGVIELAEDVTKDPHFLGLIECHNPDVKFGADGLCLDKDGNLYCGNFADGTVHRFTFDADGKVASNELFAKADCMKSADGLFYNKKTDEVLVTDSMNNAVHAVALDGTVRTIAQNGDTDGLDGGMDQPCEVLIRGNELIASNMDWPVPGCINQEYNEPATLSVVELD